MSYSIVDGDSEGDHMTELQQLVSDMAYRAGVPDSVMEASNHPYTCKCPQCLQWWVECGPEDTGDGWSFGPFTQSEYEAGGGVVPEYIVESYEDNDDDCERQDFAESLLLW